MNKTAYDLEKPLHFKSAEEYYPARGVIKLEVCVHPRQGTALNQSENSKKANLKRQDKVWALEPPSVVKLVPPENNRLFMNNSPNLFCVATLKPARTNARHEQCSEELEGSRVVSLTKLKRTNTFPDEFGIFVFSNLHVRYPGEYYLDFNLFEMVMSGNGMCAMHIAFERSQKFTVFSKTADLERPVEHSIIKEMANQGIKMRIRKVCKVNKKPKQGWECTLDEVRDSVGHAIHLSRPGNPHPEECNDDKQVGTLTARRPSEAGHFRYLPLDQNTRARSSTGSFNSTVASSSMPPPLSTPTYPTPGPSTGIPNHPLTSSAYQPGLTSTHMEGSGHGAWTHNAFSPGYQTPGAFGNHSLVGPGFSFQHGTNNNLMGVQNSNMHNIQAGVYTAGNDPRFAQPQLNAPAYGYPSQEQFNQAPSNVSHDLGSFDSGHGGYGNF